MTLVYPDDKSGNSADAEEMVLRLQGFLVQAHLPPILSRKQYAYPFLLFTYHAITKFRLGSSPSTARQSVTLSGLGSARFNDAIAAILKIHQHFHQHCPEGQMDGWEPRKERGHPVVSAGARYLSTKVDAKIGRAHV